MKKMEEKYLNFDGMPSSAPNDMPWSDTVWSNQAGVVTEEEAIRVSEIYGTALNASGARENLQGTDWQNANMSNASGAREGARENLQGTDWQNANMSNASGVKVCPCGTPGCRGCQKGQQIQPETINLDHHVNLRPDMVLDIDNARMPDSDQWSNHPGFLGWTWSAKKREAEREAAEQSKVNAAYTNTGSCAVLTSSLDKLDNSISGLEASKDKGGKGAKRVNARGRKTRKIRRPSVASGKDAACEGEAVIQQQQTTQFASMLQAPETESKSAISPTMLLIGAAVIGGAIWGISKLTQQKTI